MHLPFLQSRRALLSTVAMLAAPRKQPLIDFSASSTAADWVAVDDRIMGGASTSRVVHDGKDATDFEGNLIVEGGGFASVRYLPALSLPSDADALTLDVRGDGRMGYKLTLQSSAAQEGVSYQYSLPALDEYASLRLPLGDFKPTYRGRPAPEAPALRAADVRGVGLMLSRYEVAGGAKASIPPGAFRLSLRSLSIAESQLAINGRRWVSPPRMSAARHPRVVAMAGGLPAGVEALLPSAALKERARVVPLWRAVCACYPTEDAAIAALARNPALLYPWACSVSTIQGSYKVIVDVCGREKALEVITKNPGALGNDPTRLRASGASEIEGAANLASALGALSQVLPAILIAAALLAAATQADVADIARPVAGTVGAAAFLGTAAIAAYVASRR